MQNRQFQRFCSELRQTEFKQCVTGEELLRPEPEEVFEKINRHLVDTYGERPWEDIGFDETSLTIDGTDITTAQQLIELVDSKAINRGRVTYFSPPIDEKIAEIEVGDVTDVTIDIIIERGENGGKRYTPFRYKNSGAGDYEALDFWWDEKPTIGHIEAQDFS